MPGQIIEFACFRDDFQITHAIANGHAKLVRVDHATKRLPSPLAVRRFLEQVVVLREEHPAQFRCAVQQFGILKLTGSVFVGSKHIHPA
ncbi:hypothetical protein BH24ACT18_BH24ACT18_04360 [soil metagenome]